MNIQYGIKAFLVVSGIIFLLVALAHMLRIAYQISFLIGSVNVPMSLSVIATIIALALSALAFWLAGRKYDVK